MEISREAELFPVFFSTGLALGGDLSLHAERGGKNELPLSCTATAAGAAAPWGASACIPDPF